MVIEPSRPALAAAVMMWLTARISVFVSSKASFTSGDDTIRVLAPAPVLERERRRAVRMALLLTAVSSENKKHVVSSWSASISINGAGAVAS